MLLIQSTPEWLMPDSDDAPCQRFFLAMGSMFLFQTGGTGTFSFDRSEWMDTRKASPRRCVSSRRSAPNHRVSLNVHRPSTASTTAPSPVAQLGRVQGLDISVAEAQVSMSVAGSARAGILCRPDRGGDSGPVGCRALAVAVEPQLAEMGFLRLVQISRWNGRGKTCWRL